MGLNTELRDSFREEVRTGVKDLIDLNEIDDLDDFDAGLYISNVFDRILKTHFDLKSMEESEVKSIRAFLWSAVFTNLEIEKYESYIRNSERYNK